MVLGTKRKINKYKRRGFNVTKIHVDNEFTCIQDIVMPYHLNITYTKEHVNKIERKVCTVTEVTRCITHTFPFKRVQTLVVRKLKKVSQI